MSHSIIRKTAHVTVTDYTDSERVDISKQMISQLTCKICMSTAVSIIFLPCAHLGKS